MKKLAKLTIKTERLDVLSVNDLNLVKGGDEPYFGGTLDTITVTPGGNSDDGYDPGHD